jgi:hypothetical protein
VTRSKRDANESAILRDLRLLSVWYRQMPRETGFDLLVGFRGRLYIGEVKDPNQPPSRRALTPNEQITAAELALVEIEYPVWQTLADVLRTIGAGD